MSGDLPEELVSLFRKPEEAEALGECLRPALRAYREEADGVPETVLDPRFFGTLLPPILDHPRLSKETKRKASWTLFDVIPLPEREDEVFSTGQRVPLHLPEATRYLAQTEGLLDYHLLHLIYALYLDPARAAHASLSTNAENLFAILAGRFDERLTLLYAYLLLASPVHSQAEARRLLRIVLESPSLDAASKRALCHGCLDARFARGWFREIASVEGLLPEEEGPVAEVLMEARVRPLPEALLPVAGEWLQGCGETPEKASRSDGG